MQLTQATRLSFKFALIYIIVAGSWVVFSGELVKMLVSNPDERVYIFIIKGLGLVILTGFLLHRMMGYWLKRWEKESEQRNQAEADRRETDKKLRQSEEQLRLVLRASSDGLWDWNLQSGKAYLSPRYSEIIGYPAGEVAADLEFFRRLVHPEDWPTVQKTMNEHLAGKTDHSVVEYRLTAKNGTVKWIWGRGQVVERAPDGTPLRMVGTISDITEHKQAEQLLIAGERRYRDLFENMNEGVAYCQMIFEAGRPVDFVYLAVNQMFTTLTGLKDVVGKRVTEVIPGFRESDPELLEFYGRVATTGRPERIERFVESLHMWFDLSVYGTERDFFVVVFDVITQRKQVEAALIANEQNLQRTNARIAHLNNVLLALQAVGHVLNRERNSQNLLTAVCQSLVKTRGYVTVWVGQPEAGSKRVLPVAHSGADAAFFQHAPIMWDDSPLGLGPTGTAIRERRPVIFDDIARDPRFAPWRNSVMAGGTASIASIPIIHAEQLFGVLTIKADRPNAFDAEEVVLLSGLAEDVARALHNLEAEVARQQVTDSHARLATAVEQATETIVITDTQGTILYANPAFEKTTGYTRAEALGKNPRLFKSGQHDAVFYRRMWDVLERGETWSGHFVNRHKNGTLYEEEATISPLRDPAGTIVNYVAVKRDVTREVQLEAQFRQAQKMEAIGQLASGVAHDFNNILAVIQLQAGLLKAEQSLTDKQRDFASEIEKAGQRAANLTRQLLLFSRKQAMQARDLDLSDAVISIAKMLQRVLGEDIRMQFKFAPQPLLVHADGGMLDQILMNLTVNARDAMPKGGQLILETSAVEFDEVTAAQASQARPGSFACLSVTDTGCGIPPEILPKIFEPFFTTKDVGKGSGLGLAAVFGIVQEHRGWINVYSEAGQGTTFRIYLPRLARPSDPKAAWSSLIAERTGNETILLVEDDASVRAALHKTLSRLGYRVLEAPDGAEALAVWRQHRAEVRLLLTDLMMRGMNGKELAKLLLQQEPKLKVVFVSGHSEEINGKDFPLEEGVNFLTKPFEARKLAQIVRNCLDKN